VNLGFDISIADFEQLDDDARAAKIRTLGLPATLTAMLPGDRVTSNLLPLYAPFDGIVVGREAVVGEVIEAAKPIFEVADVSTMLLVLNVSKEDAGKVAIGQRVEFRPDGSGEEYASTITWISTEVNEEPGMLQVRAEVQNDAEPLAAARGSGPTPTAGPDRGRPARHRRRSRRGKSVQWDGSRWVVFVPRARRRSWPAPCSPACRRVTSWRSSMPPRDSRSRTRVAAGSHVLKSQILLGAMELRGSLRKPSRPEDRRPAADVAAGSPSADSCSAVPIGDSSSLRLPGMKVFSLHA